MTPDIVEIAIEGYLATVTDGLCEDDGDAWLFVHRAMRGVIKRASGLRSTAMRETLSDMLLYIGGYPRPAMLRDGR